MAGPPVLSPDLRERLEAVFDRLDLDALHAAGSEPDACSLAITARRALGGDIPDGALARKIHDFASACAFRHPMRFEVTDESAAAKAFGAVVEAAASAARDPDGAAAISRMSALLRTMAYGWPAAAAPLRTLADGYIRLTPHDEAHPLWSVFLDLRRWP